MKSKFFTCMMIQLYFTSLRISEREISNSLCSNLKASVLNLSCSSGCGCFICWNLEECISCLVTKHKRIRSHQLCPPKRHTESDFCKSIIHLLFELFRQFNINKFILCNSRIRQYEQFHIKMNFLKEQKNGPSNICYSNVMNTLKMEFE